MPQKANETLSETKARQKANSLAEQLQRFRKTGRLTKGLSRAGYINIPRGEFVATTGDSPLRRARNILGPGATESAIAAFAQAQGWDFPFRSGETYKYRGVFLRPGATPTLGYMNAITGGAAGNYLASGGTSTTPATGQITPSVGVGQVTGGTYQGQQAPVGPNANIQNQPGGVQPTSTPVARGDTGLSRFQSNKPTAARSTYQPGNIQRLAPVVTTPVWNTVSGISSDHGIPTPLPKAPTAERSSDQRIAQNQKFIQQQLAVQAQTIETAFEQSLGTRSTSGLPTSMPPNVHDSIAWPTDANGVVQSPYINVNGNMILDPRFAQAVEQMNIGLPDISADISGYSSYTNWQSGMEGNDLQAIGVSPYVRPRRGGVGTTGSNRFVSSGSGRSSGGIGTGIGIPSNWNIGIR